MKTEQFWTRETAKKFILQECNNHNTWDEEGLNLYLDEFEAEELNAKKEYEILAFRGLLQTNEGFFNLKNDGLFYYETWVEGKDNGIAFLDYQIGVIVEIYTVKRISDGEIFSIGDELGFREGDIDKDKKITKFEIAQNQIKMFVIDDKLRIHNLEHTTKPTLPQPILTTEEGDKKYKGEKAWWVETSGNFKMGECVIDVEGEWGLYNKYFSTEQAAKSFQLLARLDDIHEQCAVLHKKGIEYINEYNK